MRLTTDTFALLRAASCRAATRSRSPATTSARPARRAVQELAFTLANGIAYVEAALDAGLDVDELRAAALVLLQRAQRRVRGGRQVPRRPPPVGAHHARPLRRARPALADAALPRADRRLDADRAAAATTTSCASRCRRSPQSWAARSRCTRTASTRRSRCRPRSRPRSLCARSRSSPTRPARPTTADPLGGSYYVESLTDELERRARELIEEIDEPGGAVEAIEAGCDAGGDRGRGVRATSRQVEARRAGRRRRQPLPRGRRGSRRRSCTALDPRARAAPGRAHARAARRPRRRGGRRRA